MFKRCLCLVVAAVLAWLACACSAPAALLQPAAAPVQRRTGAGAGGGPCLRPPCQPEGGGGYP